ncbi:hypothetical protein BDP55DRAFT_187823 [Colletotrichum godetiae]|uniref:Zn(2)-C6 fungal-type domain-containing protein n=1 Tax=Colletotrichum godetiae TaxID=1209918 RepID=A0AAJ0ESN5_9PEZI|nr:uncharacterized protein BDP55DRAFT_187823 [Colletotrichum godetiae]KAK1674077.1 hypothetical protein BDP55DRAFT_187823 [Colletotrichum godetiae]
MEATGSSSKRPACDNCKDRKTKCDRETPCSSCVASNLTCHLTHRSSQRRQRVLISPRYDEAIESVDRSLKEVSQAVQKLLEINQQKSHSSPLASPPSFTGCHSPSISGLSEGYRGESSFKAHVQRVTDALKNAASDLESTLGDDTALSATVQMIDHATLSEEKSSAQAHMSPLSFQAQYPELDSRSLPPVESVLKLVRLCQTEKQRFFVDVPVIDEQEFGEICQKVCFAIANFSITDWVIVNVGLFFLLQGLNQHHYSHFGITKLDLETYSQLLKANVEAAIQSLRLCSDPSMQACQALAVLYTFCNKIGRSALAWQLISAASRMCIDLGWHRLSSDEPKFSKRRQVFWHVYVHDKSMAFTMGRTPAIHPYDVSTERPFIPKDHVSGVPVYLYAGFIEYAFIVGDMHVELFSASALRKPLEIRSQSATQVVSKLLEVNERIKQCVKDDPSDDDLYEALTVLLDFMMYGLVTIAYRVIPSHEPSDGPLKCSDECTEAARNALRTIVRAFESWGHLRISGWTMLLNMMFSLVPFACFVVLAGNTVATASEEDLTLLCSAISAIEPTSDSSPSAKKLYDVCKTFYELASFSVKRKDSIGMRLQQVEQVYGQQALEDIPPLPEVNLAAPSYDHIMAPQDWEAVMDEFDLGTGAGALASFVEPYIPFDGRIP